MCVTNRKILHTRILLVDLIVKMLFFLYCHYQKEDVVWLLMRRLTTIGHRTAFNNEQSPYHIVSYKSHRNYKYKQFKREN